MKKSNLKKLALMGIAGGVTLCSSASASEIIKTDDAAHFLAAGCGGGKCGSVAYQPRSSCGAQQPQSYYNNAPAQPQPYAPQSGCSAAPRPANNPNGNFTAYQPHSGCGAQQPQYYTAPQSSCNAQPRPQGGCQGIAQPQAYNASKNISQWETSNYTAATNAVTTANSTEEAQVLSQLNEEGKAIYRGLDPAGKALANQLIKQDSYKDKNQAVKAAAQKMSEKRASANSYRA